MRRHPLECTSLSGIDRNEGKDFLRNRSTLRFHLMRESIHTLWTVVRIISLNPLCNLFDFVSQSFLGHVFQDEVFRISDGVQHGLKVRMKVPWLKDSIQFDLTPT